MIARMVITGLLVASQAACTTITPHENFEQHMGKNVGKNIDDPNLRWRRPDRFIEQRTLPNGNVEETYQLRGSCRYFFEIDPNSKKVVSWRSEGSKNDCEIPL
jgi:hypothetical protein